MSVFDLSKPGVAVTPSSFGGGWAWALSVGGAVSLREFFGEAPTEIPVFGEGGAVIGYIVEPYQTGDLAEHLRADDVAWEVR